jgi:hypothetical protein
MRKLTQPAINTILVSSSTSCSRGEPHSELADRFGRCPASISNNQSFENRSSHSLERPAVERAYSRPPWYSLRGRLQGNQLSVVIDHCLPRMNRIGFHRLHMAVGQRASEYKRKRVHPTIWGDELKKADMLVTSGVVFSGTTFQRRVQHVHRLIVS